MHNKPQCQLVELSIFLFILFQYQRKHFGILYCQVLEEFFPTYLTDCFFLCWLPKLHLNCHFHFFFTSPPCWGLFPLALFSPFSPPTLFICFPHDKPPVSWVTEFLCFFYNFLLCTSVFGLIVLSTELHLLNLLLANVHFRRTALDEFHITSHICLAFGSCGRQMLLAALLLLLRTFFWLGIFNKPHLLGTNVAFYTLVITTKLFKMYTRHIWNASVLNIGSAALM